MPLDCTAIPCCRRGSAQMVGIAAFAIGAFGAAIPARAQPTACATVHPATAFRRQALHITLASEQVRSWALPDGQTTRLAVSFSTLGAPPLPTTDADVKNAVIEVAVPPSAPLGDYIVSIRRPDTPAQPAANGAAATAARAFPPCDVTLKLRSPAVPTMGAFVPAGTYDTSTAVMLTIRGTGFLTDVPEDNLVFVNQKELKPITWWHEGDLEPRCGPGVTPSSPKIVTAYAESAQVIHVCNVPAADARRDEGWLSSLGLTPKIVRVAVGQPGVQPTAPWPLRRYPSWAGTKTAALVSIAIAVALATFVLWCVLMFNRASVDHAFSPWTLLFLDSETDTYSLSKLQFYLWTIAALFGYSYLVIGTLLVQGEPWPELPGNLPAIVGIGIGTAVGAQVVTNIRGPKGSGTERPSAGDLVMSGGVVAPDRVQMLVWTIIGIGIFCIAVLQHSPDEIKGLDTIPSSLLLMAGLSSAGYLGGKLARKPGPVLDEITIDPPEPDDKLTAAAVPPPGTVNLTAALAGADNIILSAPGALAAKTAIDALIEAKAIARGVKTVAQAAAVVPAIAAKRQAAEAGAKGAAEAMLKANSADAALAAETAQRAAAAIHDLETATRDASASFTDRPIGAPQFTRTITLRGRNLSPHALFSIDGLALPFRMLAPDSTDPAATRAPQILIPEVDNPELAMMLRLSIDPAQLEPVDRAVHDKWFATTGSHIVKLTNPDGQQDDLRLSVPPASAQAAGKGGASPANVAGANTPGGGGGSPSTGVQGSAAAQAAGTTQGKTQ